MGMQETLSVCVSLSFNVLIWTVHNNTRPAGLTGLLQEEEYVEYMIWKLWSDEHLITEV